MDKNPTTIIGFFARLAIKLGADESLNSELKEADRDYYHEGGVNYRISYYFGDNMDEYLTVYGSGEFDCEFKGKFVSGKLPPPHSKTWVRRLVKNGVPVDFARSQWGNYYGFRHGLRKSP